MSRYREKCNEACTGCVHDGHKWVSMSPTCAAEFNERHVQAAIDHNERESSKLPEQSEAV